MTPLRRHCLPRQRLVVLVLLLASWTDARGQEPGWAPGGGDADSPWQWRIGVAGRTEMQVSVRGRSHTQAGGALAHVPGRDAIVVGQPEVAADEVSAATDRTFDDGYVRTSPPTTFGIPLVNVPPGEVTWFWGYERAAQYDAAAEAITFTRQSSSMVSGREFVRQATVARDNEIAARDDMDAAGVEAELSRRVWRRGRLGLGVSLGAQAFAAASATVAAQP